MATSFFFLKAVELFTFLKVMFLFRAQLFNVHKCKLHVKIRVSLSIENQLWCFMKLGKKKVSKTKKIEKAFTVLSESILY